MFDKFGEFDSVEELNRAAAEKKAAGDVDALVELAKENGIDVEDAEDYMDDCVDKLATPLMAAIGKLKVESKKLDLKGITEDWKDSIVKLCTDDEEMCIAVRKKGKNLANCMAKLIKFAFENKVKISDDIVKVTKVMHNGKEEQMRSPLYLGIPNNAEAKKIIREYYIGR